VLVDGELVASSSLSRTVQILRDLTTGEITRSEAEPEELTFELGVSGGVERLVEIRLPYSESVELISIDADEPLAPADQRAPTWVHYGSSISQGSNAATAATIWTAVAARLGGVELTNLGFGGSALLDPFVARTMRDLPVELISVKVGINIVNSDLMRRRAFAPALHGFLDVIRDGHPDTPLLLVTPLWSPIFEHTPGPGAFDPDALARGRPDSSLLATRRRSKEENSTSPRSALTSTRCFRTVPHPTRTSSRLTERPSTGRATHSRTRSRMTSTRMLPPISSSVGDSPSGFLE